MVCLDSNIIIYAVKSDYPNIRNWLRTKVSAVSDISRIEVLGYHEITSLEIEIIEKFFSFCTIIPIEVAIINKAIQLRQKKRISLGDAIVGATSIVYNIPLVTANTDDFKHLSEIQLINPFEGF